MLHRAVANRFCLKRLTLAPAHRLTNQVEDRHGQRPRPGLPGRPQRRLERDSSMFLQTLQKKEYGLR